jgi:glycine cleavage system H protein
MSLLSLFCRNTLISRINKDTFNHLRYFTTYYSESHEWIKLYDNDTKGIIGITDYAQKSMGDVVFCDLESVGEKLHMGDILGSVESVKASSDIHIPISGDIIEVNEEIETESSIINTSAMDKGWLIKIDINDKDEIKKLLTETEYREVCEND